MSMTGAFLDCEAARAFAGKRVLLTGASGFIGGHVARQALAAGVEVHALGRRPGPDGTRFCPADLTDGTAIEGAVRSISPDLILHLASPGVAFGTADFTTILESLVTGGAALLRGAAALARPPHFVQTGSGFEYASQDRPTTEDDPIVPAATSYGAAKAAASALLGGFRDTLPITLVRPFNVYGAGDSAPRLANAIIAKALAGETMAVSEGRQLRDFLHVDDFGRLLWILASQGGDPCRFAVFNAGSGQPVPLRRYVAAVATALEQCGVTARIDYGAVPYRPGEPMIAVPDLTRLQAACSWRAQIALADGVIDHVRWRLQQ